MSYQIGFGQSYTKMGRKMTCDRWALFWALYMLQVGRWDTVTLTVQYMGNIWQGKILVNHAGKSYWWGKIYWISAYTICVFRVSVNTGEGNVGEWLTFANFFAYQNFPVYGIHSCVYNTLPYSPMYHSFHTYHNECVWFLVSLYTMGNFWGTNFCKFYG